MKHKIMFLDDEIFSNDNGIAIQAANLLEENGYDVVRTEKMSEVIDSFYKDYYDLYVLDIDMGKVEDVIIDENGTTVGKRLRQLSTNSKIIIFSARGEIEDWFSAANYHFDAYVHKKNGKKELLKMVNEEIQKDNKIAFHFSEKERDKLTYYYYAKNNFITEEEVNSILNTLSNKIIKFEKIGDLLDTLRKKNEKPELIVIIANTFKNRDSVRNTFVELFSFQNEPHIVMSYLGDDNDQDLIIHLINQNPFRLINLKDNIKENLKEAVEAATLWYGRDEIFELPEDDKIVRFPLTDEEIEDITKDDNDFYYEDEDE